MAKFLDLFSGIGGFRLGMTAAGHECIGHCEIDKYARASYNAIYNTESEIEFHDITQISDSTFRKFRGIVDIICAGFPCQPFSIVGNGKGFDDTRGTLFFEIERATKEIKPRYLFLENVKGLLSHDKGRTFSVIINALDELGYRVEWCVLDSKYFNVPQQRERTFIIATRKDIQQKPILFSVWLNNRTVTQRLQDILEDQVDERFYLSEEKTSRLIAELEDMPVHHSLLDTRHRSADMKAGKKGIRVSNDICPTITASDTKDLKKIVEVSTHPIKLGNIDLNGHDYIKRVYSPFGQSPTLTTMTGGNTEPKIAELYKQYRIRKLTPKECWRLQGFPDWAFDRAASVNSNSQLYKQAGNSVTVNVIAEIAKHLI